MFWKKFNMTIFTDLICTKLSVIVQLSFLECRDRNPNLCKSMIKKLGDRACHGEWFTDPHGQYGCKKSCNCCYERECTCNDRNEEECKSYVKLFGKKNCKRDWFISYGGKYGCRKSCGLCSKWAH